MSLLPSFRASTPPHPTLTKTRHSERSLRSEESLCSFLVPHRAFANRVLGGGGISRHA